MSLNGLDDPAVIDAYQTALAEAGGWLLLNYASRDEVALLGRGTGGVPDVRATVEGYEDKSPLYGFLQYRRRKIILKYLPDGMSRLLQARTTVQFQSILDKFSPHDTTFEFKASGDLTESALSSACLLHAVSGSITSSSSSLRRRRLMEIAEDAEEGPPDDLAPVAPPSSSPDDSDDKRLSQMSDATAVPPKKEQKKEDSSSIASTTTTTTNVVDNDADARTETASVHSVSRKRFLDQFHRDSFDRRSSTQSARPTLQELNYAAPYRQKVKLEHRPSVDINNRPRTAGSMSRGQDHRPVAALPAGVRSRKPAGNPNRPKSTHDVPPPMPTLASLRNAPPVPLLIPPPTLSIAKPRMSPGAKSMNAIPSSGMSPEKQRLMKALELRKKQMEKKTADLQKKQEQTSNDTTRKPTVMESLEADKENIGHSPVKKTSSEATVTGPEALAVATIDVNDEKPLSADIAKADSAVEMVTMASKDIEEIPDGAAHEEENSGRGTDDANHSLETPLEDNFKDDAMDSTNTELAREETLAQRTADEDTTTRLPEEAELEEQQKPMQANEESSPHELEVPTITVEDDNEQMEPEFTVAGPADEEIQRIPIAVAIEPEAAAAAAEEEVRAEDVPLPPEAEEDLGLPEAPTALVPTQPMQPMQPLPHPQPQPQRLEKHKRITLLEPIQVPTPDFSDDENLLSDDSLMDELTSATVQEAKPVPVGKGPLSPDAEAWQQTRSVSNPNRGRPSDFSSLPVDTRSISATFADGSNQAIRPMVAKKVNVSSGISKRIKALEMFSNNRDSAPNPTTTAAAATGNVASPTASAFEKFRKRASISLNGNLPSTTPSARSSFISTSDSFPVNRSDSRSISKLNSVSVTARIVRDPSTPPSELKANPVDTTVLGFQRSSLIVRHDSSETQTSDQMSSSHSAFSPKSSRRNSTDTAVVPPRSDSRASSRSRFDERGRRDTGASPDDKKDSRTSRLMRRMSSLRSSSRMNLISPPGVDKQQLPPPPAEETVRRHPPSRAIDIGEVNVQFPDTLLWKRRYLRVDDQGYLVLTPGNMDTGARNVVKRYHLSEFKTPCLPDEERQELPNSILLDFRDGSTLQCACESRKGQAAALQTLVDAHNAYHQ